MTRKAHATILVEDTAATSELVPQHGFSCWVDTGEHRILFDTAQAPGDALSHNARKLGVPLHEADAVVLSHGHYDHTGGLVFALLLAPDARVYAHPSAFQPKYALDPEDKGRSIGMPMTGNAMGWRVDGLIGTTEPTEICEGVFVTGEIPRTTEFEDTGGDFFLDGSCKNPDPLIDDQALFIKAELGTVVILGCAHAGAINTLSYIRDLTDGAPIHAVIGGMHLLNASSQRMKSVLEALVELDVHQLWPGHCTGEAGFAQIQAAFPNRCSRCCSGARVSFPI